MNSFITSAMYNGIILAIQINSKILMLVYSYRMQASIASEGVFYIVYCANSLRRIGLRVVRLYLRRGISHWADLDDTP